MLTRIAAVTAVVSAAVNLAVLFGWDLTADKIAGINALVVAVGSLVHGLYNPNIPLGVTSKE